MLRGYISSSRANWDGDVNETLTLIAAAMVAPSVSPAQAGQLKIGETVKLARDSQLPSCRTVDAAVLMEVRTHFRTKEFNAYMNSSNAHCNVVLGLYNDRYRVTASASHWADDGSKDESQRWYRLCDKDECSWVLRDEQKNSWVGILD